MTAKDPKDLFLGLDFEVEIPSTEEMLARRQIAWDWTAQSLVRRDNILHRTAACAPARFNTLSLPAWLALAARAGITHIPARLLAEVDYIDYFNSFEAEETPAYRTFHAKVIKDLQISEMVRMEQVAPRDIKVELSAGSNMTNGLTRLRNGDLYLDLFEDRFLTTLDDLGEQFIRAYARPFIPTLRKNGMFRGKDGSWPVEFRVFVENGQIVGISNYYPQITLDETYDHLFQDALTSAQIMLNTMKDLHLGVGNHALGATPAPEDTQRDIWVPQDWSRQDFTLDFIADPTGLVHFLEGGPAGMAAAHPCCFLQEGRPMDETFLHGIALGPETEILPLNAFDNAYGDRSC